MQLPSALSVLHSVSTLRRGRVRFSVHLFWDLVAGVVAQARRTARPHCVVVRLQRESEKKTRQNINKRNTAKRCVPERVESVVSITCVYVIGVTRRRPFSLKNMPKMN